MRCCIGLLILALVGCGSDPGEGAPAEESEPLPEVLADLVLARDSDEITPVVFPHALHQDPQFVGRALACADCHHTLADLPSSIPKACGGCHLHERVEGMPDI